MKLAIMQPYFFPYIGYFQLISAVDKFIVYDNIKYVKGGWINRNRILVNGEPKWISLSLKNDSDYLHIRDRRLMNGMENNKRLLHRIEAAYKKAPNFRQVYPLVENCLTYPDENLFNFLFHSITEVCKFLAIQTELIVSSSVPINHFLKKQDKVIAFCNYFSVDTYINLPGGKALYDKHIFSEQGISLYFLEPENITYNQGGNSFVPQLSIIDVLMFNELERVKAYLTMYRLT
mgnify:CR=1 FL=1